MCYRHPEALSKNNKDIGRTTLIEMEIDTGDSLPVTQNPYTLSLKHHKWLQKKIEATRKSWSNRKKLVPMGIAGNSGPKKSVPDEPLRRPLCVDY